MNLETKMLLDMSVIIPLKNRVASIESVLWGLHHQTMEHDRFDVIVIDDGSEDGSLEKSVQLLPKLNLSIRVIKVTRHSSAFKAGLIRNIGANQSHAKVLLFLDADVIPDPFCLEQHWQSHQSADHAPLVVLGYVFRLAQAYQPQATRYIKNNLICLLQQLPLFPDIREANYQHIQVDQIGIDHSPAPWRFCYSNNFSIRRETFFAVGCFDETFNGWGDEDLELGYRLYKSKTRFILNRNAIGIHYEHDSDFKTKYHEIFVNKFAFIKKHPNLDSELYNEPFSDLLKVTSFQTQLNQSFPTNIPSDTILSYLKGHLDASQRNLVLGLCTPVDLGNTEATWVHPQIDSSQGMPLSGVFLPFPDQHMDHLICIDYIQHLEDYLFFRIILESLRIAKRVSLLFSSELTSSQQKILHSFQWTHEYSLFDDHNVYGIHLVRKIYPTSPKINLICNRNFEFPHHQAQLLSYISNLVDMSDFSCEADFDFYDLIKKKNYPVLDHIGSFAYLLFKSQAEFDEDKWHLHYEPATLTPRFGRNILLTSSLETLCRQEIATTIHQRFFDQTILLSKEPCSLDIEANQIRSILRQCTYPKQDAAFNQSHPIFIEYIQQANKLLTEEKKKREAIQHKIKEIAHASPDPLPFHVLWETICDLIIQNADIPADRHIEWALMIHNREAIRRTLAQYRDKLSDSAIAAATEYLNG